VAERRLPGERRLNTGCVRGEHSRASSSVRRTAASTSSSGSSSCATTPPGAQGWAFTTRG